MKPAALTPTTRLKIRYLSDKRIIFSSIIDFANTKIVWPTSLTSFRNDSFWLRNTFVDHDVDQANRIDALLHGVGRNVCVFNRGACVVRPWKESATHHRATLFDTGLVTRSKEVSQHPLNRYHTYSF
jgi:hypothetical protein